MHNKEIFSFLLDLIIFEATPIYIANSYDMFSHDTSWSNGLVFKALDFQFCGPVFKTTTWL